MGTVIVKDKKIEGEKIVVKDGKWFIDGEEREISSFEDINNKDINNTV